MGDRVYERFVECPEIIEIRWVSDDPDHHRPSEDMYHCQLNGIPEEYGKKDKRTTEQAHFYCCVCECQSASLKTLRAHCEGTQHKRKAEQFFQQYQHRQRKKSVTSNDSPSTGDTSRTSSRNIAHLAELRRSTQVVGLQYVEEYRPNDRADPPLYICILQNCKINNCEFKGEAAKMFEHLKSESHGCSYFHRLYGNEFCLDDYDYADLLRKTVQEEQRYYYKEILVKHPRDYKSVQSGHRPDSSYVRETMQLEQEKRQPPKQLPAKTQRRSSEQGSDSNISTQIQTANSQEPNGNNTSAHVKSEQNMNDNDERNGIIRKRRICDQETEVPDSESKLPRTTYSEKNPLCILPPALQVKPQPDLSLVDENEVASVEQKPFSNQGEAQHNSKHEGIAAVQQPPQMHDPVKEFNKVIASWVMSCMNKYYQYEGNRETCERKISDKDEYQNLAREFSRQYRKVEKESYLSVNSTLDGLEINLDMKDRIKMQIDMYFENRPLLPLD